jgi:hypothetical protein
MKIADRKITRSIAALACVGIGLGLAACGGGGSSKQGSPAATTTATTPTLIGPGTNNGTTSGAKTPPGAKLKVGQTAHVTFKPLNAPAASKKTYKLDVTVLKIEKGTIDDFKNVNLDAAQKKSTPYYVSVRVSNPGAEVPVKNDDPDIRFDGIDDRGQEQGSVTFFGTFDRCDDKSAPAPFTTGKSYESCLTYLLPGGGSIQQVHWSGSDEYVLKPVSWS